MAVQLMIQVKMFAPSHSSVFEEVKTLILIKSASCLKDSIRFEEAHILTRKAAHSRTQTLAIGSVH